MNHKGLSALSIACMQGDIKVMKLLLRYGATPTAVTTRKGLSLMTMAHDGANKETIQLLLRMSVVCEVSQ